MISAWSGLNTTYTKPQIWKTLASFSAVGTDKESPGRLHYTYIKKYAGGFFTLQDPFGYIHICH